MHLQIFQINSSIFHKFQRILFYNSIQILKSYVWYTWWYTKNIVIYDAFNIYMKFKNTVYLNSNHIIYHHVQSNSTPKTIIFPKCNKESKMFITQKIATQFFYFPLNVVSRRILFWVAASQFFPILSVTKTFNLNSTNFKLFRNM